MTIPSHRRVQSMRQCTTINSLETQTISFQTDLETYNHFGIIIHQSSDQEGGSARTPGSAYPGVS